MQNLDALKRSFREGRHAEAIAGCEALIRADPTDRAAKKLCATMNAVARQYPRALELLRELHAADPRDADALFNIATCERESGDVVAAERDFKRYTERFAADSAGWASLAECQCQLRRFDDGIRSADRAIKLDAASVPAWSARGQCQKGLGKLDAALESFARANRIHPTAECWLDAGLVCVELKRLDDAIAAFGHAIKLAPDVARLRVLRGDALHGAGRTQDAVADYRQALKLAPDDDETLKKASMLLLQADRGVDAVELCREIERAAPSSVTAKLGAEWVLSQLVPLWHVPMMNEAERNRAYRDGLARVVTPDTTVFEVGTGSGLLAMMAASLGAAHVHTCEAVPLIAETARRVVARNGLQDRVTVLSKPSQAVRLGAGQDLPARADVLVHEIFSSELLGEAVLPAIEDAKARLLKPGGKVLPRAASIMIALVGGDALGAHLRVDEAHGFDLRDFNAIVPKKLPLHREDLAPVAMGDDVEAFRFDFAGASAFPAERRAIAMTARVGGRCFGIVQWIRVELGDGIVYENHPSVRRVVANWQCTVYGFAEPIELAAGAVVTVNAMHDRSRPWFELAGVAGG